MKYSKALIESLEAAQLLAGHFTTDYLESWHLLIALANNPYSVAGSVLNEFSVEVDGFEEAAFQITGQAYQKDGHFELLPFSYRLEELFGLERPSTISAMAWPNSAASSSLLVPVSSSTSCSTPAHRPWASICHSASCWATAMGWVM